LLIRGNALLVLDLGLNVVDGVGRLDVEGDGLSGKCFHEDLNWTKRNNRREVRNTTDDERY
jgi:hypothetical protein